mmetsp:Transcript_2405/g.5721  ORF Transcript_2405/g.5721 Transcript_2405/m.5721 type:complete len:107 (+) Transcript_2405:938-1258(+)
MGSNMFHSSRSILVLSPSHPCPTALLFLSSRLVSSRLLSTSVWPTPLLEISSFKQGVAAPLIAKLVDIDLELAYKRAVRVEEQVDYAGKQAEELLGMPQEVFEKVT